jgi:hypothetical protein
MNMKLSKGARRAMTSALHNALVEETPTLRLDRAEFMRRTEDDIITCTREGSCELVAGQMLNALVWFTKVPLLRSLREHKDFAFETDLIVFEDARNAIMTNLPTLAEVSRELGKAYDAGAGVPNTHYGAKDNDTITLADIERASKALEAANIPPDEQGNYTLRALRKTVDPALVKPTTPLTPYGEALRRNPGIDAAEARCKARMGLQPHQHAGDLMMGFDPAIPGSERTGVFIRSSRGGKTTELLRRAYEAMRRLTPGERMKTPLNRAVLEEIARVRPMTGEHASFLIIDDPFRDPPAPIAPDIEDIDREGYKRGFQDAQKMHAEDEALKKRCRDHLAPLARRMNPGGHGHVLKHNEPSGAGWRDEGSAVQAARAHRRNLAEKGETFVCHVFHCQDADEVLLVERTQRDRAPLRSVFMTGMAWTQWLAAWGHFPTQAEMTYLLDGHSQGYVHAMHPNQRQLEDMTERAMREEPMGSGYAMKVMHEMQVEQMQHASINAMRSFGLSMADRPAEPSRIAQLFKRDLEALSPKMGAKKPCIDCGGGGHVCIGRTGPDEEDKQYGPCTTCGGEP